MSRFISLGESLQGGSFCFLVRDSPIPLAITERSDIFFPARSQRALQGAGLWSPEGLLRSTEASLRRIPGVGGKTVQLVRALLEFYGLSLGRRLGKDLKLAIQDVTTWRQWQGVDWADRTVLREYPKFFQGALDGQVLRVKYLKVLLRVAPLEGSSHLDTNQQESVALLLQRVGCPNYGATQKSLLQEIQRRRTIMKDIRRCLRKMRGSKDTPLELVARTLHGLKLSW